MLLEGTSDIAMESKTPILKRSTDRLSIKEDSPPRQTYEFDEVFAAALSYFEGDELAANTWATKYALRNRHGEFLELTPAATHRRIAREFARIERKYPSPMTESEIFELLADWTVVPQGSPMSAMGNEYQLQSVSNCFVVPSPEDSYGGILFADQQQAQIMKRRGGVGMDLSSIRPKGMATANAACTTDGIGVFMERFSHTCKEVAQGGRRGALMLTCDVHHPEIRTFIGIKNERSSCPACGHEERLKVTGANVSVRLSDEFLEAVEKGNAYQLRWPCDPRKKAIVEDWVDAREIWNEIMVHARDSAEPGLLFWDNILRESPADCYADEGYRTECTNPCSEIPLSAYDSCRLMVVNLARFVKAPFTAEASFDWERFRDVVGKAQRLMDDLVDIELEQVDKIIAKIECDPEKPEVKQVEKALWHRIRQAASGGRRTGLGVTAVGDTVAMLGHRYGSEASIEVVEKIYEALAVSSYDASITLAEERSPFPVFDFRKEEGHPFLARVLAAGGPKMRERYRKYGRRNIANLTTAPTGSVSLLTQTTSGIEPVFKAVYTRKKKVHINDVNARIDEVDAHGDKWTYYDVKEPGLRLWQAVTGKGDDALAESPYYGAEAEQIDWHQRVRLQARANRWIDHAISSTVNLPEDVTTDDVKKIYVEAWRSGCKGITIYRKNSRQGVLVEKREFHEHAAPERPGLLPCDVHRSRVRVGTEYEDWIFFVGLFEDKPFEIFGGSTDRIELPRKVTGGWISKRNLKSGGKYDFVYGDADDPTRIKDIVAQFNNPDQGWATRMISLSLRHGAPIQYVVDQLNRDREADMFDFAKSCSRVLKKYVPDGAAPSHRRCGECGAEDTLRFQEGCLTCSSCGASRCG